MECGGNERFSNQIAKYNRGVHSWYLTLCSFVCGFLCDTADSSHSRVQSLPPLLCVFFLLLFIFLKSLSKKEVFLVCVGPHSTLLAPIFPNPS